MRVLICEPNVAGHFLHYASLAVRAAQAVTPDVVVGLSPQALGTCWYQHFVRPLEGRVTILTNYDAHKVRESSVSARVRNSLAEWVFLQRYIRETRPDHVILPSANRVGNALLWLPQATNHGAEIELVQFNSILGRSSAHWGRVEKWLHPLMSPRAPTVTRFHFTDQTQYATARRQYPTEAPRFRPLADPIDLFDPLARDEARQALGLPLQGRIAVMLSPTPYKGAMRLLDLFRTRATPEDCRLLLVGHVHDSVERFVDEHLADQRREGRVVLLTDRTEEIDLHRAICASDVVVPRLTPMHGTSAMCLRAAIAGRRFFAASSPWMEMMADLGFGDCVVNRRPEALAAAFRGTLARSGEPLDLGLVRRLRRFHSPENFTGGISARIRERAGLVSRTAVSWQWVLEGASHPARSFAIA